MEQNQFTCKRCGYCCRTLLEFDGKVLRGLALLTQEERERFDPKDIVPQWAIGKEKPTTILTYQLKLATCPHIQKDNTCAIYDKRPLACQAYPVTSTVGGATADLKCPEISKLTSRQLFETIFSDQIDEAMDKINLIVGNIVKKKSSANFWDYNIATNTWVMEYSK